MSNSQIGNQNARIGARRKRVRQWHQSNMLDRQILEIANEHATDGAVIPLKHAIESLVRRIFIDLQLDPPFRENGGGESGRDKSEL